MTASPVDWPWLLSAPSFEAGAGVAAHVRIEQWLAGVIGRGELRPGDRLPREDDFAAALGVSRMTLRQALATLEARGAILRKIGRAGGTFVGQPRIDCDLTGLAGFTEQMRRANMRAGARMVSARTVRAGGAVAAALSLSKTAEVHEVVRVRTARKEPLALERSYFPAADFPDLLAHRLTGSLYALLTQRYGQAPNTASESLEPVVAGEDEARHLGVEQGSPLLLIERIAYTAGGRAVEYALDLFRPDRVRVTFQTGLGAVGASPTRAPKRS